MNSNPLLLPDREDKWTANEETVTTMWRQTKQRDVEKYGAEFNYINNNKEN